MSFLDKARKLECQHPLRPRHEDRMLHLLAAHCWPKLLAVVEAARKCAPMMPQDTSEHYQNVVELDKALDALDRKAGECRR